MAYLEINKIHHQERKENDSGRLHHVFIDVDSCLAGIEGIDELAELHNCGSEVARLTLAAMNGEVRLEEVFERRLSLIRPRIEDLKVLGQTYINTLTPHALQTINFLQGIGMGVWLISGGYDEAIFPLADYLGISRGHVLANHLYFDSEGEYLDFDRTNPLCRQFGKRECIARLKTNGTVQGKIAIVGDGVSEIETEGIVDVCIGFGGHVEREQVRKAATYFVGENTFIPLVPILLSCTEY